MAETTTVAEHATETPFTVDQAMIAVMREIGPVGKNGRNSDQGYNFRAQEDIVAAARGPMARHGLRMLPKIISHDHFTRGKMNVAIIEVEYTFRGPTGDEMPPILVIGEGADPSDKASNKAMTAAKKYAMIQAFEIADGSDDGDKDHPAAVRGPLDWYIEQIQQASVWYDPEALRRLRDKAASEGVADLQMPDGTHTFRQVVETQGRKLLAEQQEREHRQAEEAEAARAQMASEFPDPPGSYEEWSQPAPARQTPPRAPQHPAPTPTPAPQQQRTPAPGPAPSPVRAAPPPDAAEVEREFAKAVANPTYGHQALNDMRAHYGAGPLAQTAINTERWGTVDANSAITMALTSWDSIVRELLPSTPEPTRSAAPDAGAETAAAGTSEPSQPRLARRTANMSAEERAREATIAEAVLQAQMLEMDTLEYVADLLPPGATDIEDIKGGSRLMDLVRDHRPQVLAVFTQKGMTKAAAEYAKFGERVPARDINAFLKGVLGVG
ncbi:ERF family protein [Streptomyces coeruleorubidus]|uniref:ERF family protein n=1 Tax=Streptomyces coeruleorubidus TaxID=116188 RepID=UPI0033A8412E